MARRAALAGGYRPPVRRSTDLDRVVALPRRPPPDLDEVGAAYVEKAMRLYGRGERDCRCQSEWKRPCVERPFPVQAWALHEMTVTSGLLGGIGVGAGKTFLDVMAAMAVPGVKQAVLLIPPGLREQLKREYLVIAEHFNVPSIRVGDWGVIHPGRPVLHVVAYSLLSQQDATDLLERLRPDLIIADEAHCVRNAGAARTRRFLRYFLEHPEVRLVCWSGTMTSKSILDYGHLSRISLRESSPLPLRREVAEEWALAIDPSDWPAPAGDLDRLMRPGEGIYSAFHRRLTETRGVVATKASAAPMSLNIFEREPPAIPAQILPHFDRLRGDWIRPDEEELVDLLQVAKSARELSCGFYYHWRFPRGESPELVRKWYKARKAWHQEVRARLRRAEPHLDSPGLLRNAAARAWVADPDPDSRPGQVWWRDDGMPMWKAVCFPAWREIESQVEPYEATTWIDDWLARDAAEWAKEHRGVVWYAHHAFGARVAELAGIPMHGGGPDAEVKILAEDGSRSICASIKAHGTGRNGLQFLYNEQLVANPPADGAAWEQLLGRLHREGQREYEVNTWVYRHTPEMSAAIDQAVRRCKYIEATWENPQKLLLATVDFELGDDSLLPGYDE